MKKGIILRITAALMLLLPLTSLLAQLPEVSRQQYDKLPFFSHGVYFSMGDASGTRMDLIHQIRHESIQFVKGDSLYEGGYELAVQIETDQEEVVITRILKRDVSVPYFEETISLEDFDSAQQHFMVPPGEYVVSLALTDRESGKTARKRFNIRVPDLADRDLAVSSLIFGYTTPGRDGEDPMWHPFVDRVVPENTREIEIRFTVYNRTGLRELPYQYEIKSVRKKNRTQRKHEDMVAIGDSVAEISLPLSLADLPVGAYTFKFEAGTGRNKIKRETMIVLHMSGLPTVVDDLTEAIESMVHIADGNDVKAMLKADPEKQREMFLEFWEKRDPTPETPVNEIMDEYYRRVDYCKRSFGRFNPGWKTDRGRIYIIFGQPDDVIRRPFEADRHPYEIWFFTRFNRNFYFEDEHGYGEYRLKTPNWDLFY